MSHFFEYELSNEKISKSHVKDAVKKRINYKKQFQLLVFEFRRGIRNCKKQNTLYKKDWDIFEGFKSQ